MTSLSSLPVQRECERLEGVVTLGAQCCLCGCPEPSQLTVDLIPPLQSDTNGRSHAHVITLSFLSIVSLLCTFCCRILLLPSFRWRSFPSDPFLAGREAAGDVGRPVGRHAGGEVRRAACQGGAPPAGWRGELQV